jgi:O-acetylserine/cysteine efflux transporter
MKHALAPRDLLLTLAVVTLLGFTFVPIKVGLRELPPFALAALRYFFAAVPLVLVIRRPRMPWPDVVGYGLAIGVFQFGLLFLGMQLGMPAGLTSLVIQVQVFFTIGLAIAFLGDRLHRHNLVGAGIATAGIAIVAVRQLSEGAHATLVGFALVIVAAFAWGVVLFLAWGATLFGFASWARLLHRYPTGLIAPFALLLPVSGIVSGAIFLGESLAPLQAVGGALVFAGLAENVYGPRIRAWVCRAR